MKPPVNRAPAQVGTAVGPAAAGGAPAPGPAWPGRARAGLGAALAGWVDGLPGQCEICRRWNRARLCADCLARHAAWRPRCARCGLHTGAPLAACGDCLREPPPFQRTCCAVDYVFPWAQLLQAFKFHGQDDLARPLARLLADAVLAEAVLAEAVLATAGPQACRADTAAQTAHDADHAPDRSPAHSLPDLLLPVPLSAERLRQRGYNQAWELARRTGRLLQRPARADLLQRAQQGLAQAESSRAQRQHNLRGVFQVPAAAQPELQARHLALVDDVMTTGATAREAATALLAAGAARVDVWVLARTPAPGG